MKKKRANKVLLLVASGALLVWAGGKGLLDPLRGAINFVITPVGSVFSSAGSGTGNFLRTFIQVRDLSEKNAKLEKEVAELQQRLSEDAELRHQNETLKRQLGFGEAASRQLIPAEVVAYQPDNFRQFVTINRGTNSGVKEGMAVISEGALVGKITEVDKSTAKVFLVTDPNFKVGGLSQDSRATGTIKGQLGSGLIMDKIAQSEVVKPGDTILTSGLGGDLPKGIIIGQVESVNQSDNAVFQTAQVASPLRFSKLEVVFVVVSL